MKFYKILPIFLFVCLFYQNVFAQDSYLKLIVDKNWGNNLNYIELKTFIVDSVTPCHRNDTIGSMDEDLLETLGANRGILVNFLLSHLIDDVASNRKRIFIDPLIYGVNTFDSPVPGYDFEIALENNVVCFFQAKKGNKHFSKLNKNGDMGCNFYYNR